MVPGTKTIVSFALPIALLTACNLPAVQLKATADVQKTLTPQVVDTYWDPEIVEYAIAQSLVESEFGMKVIGDYEPA